MCWQETFLLSCSMPVCLSILPRKSCGLPSSSRNLPTVLAAVADVQTSPLDGILWGVPRIVRSVGSGLMHLPKNHLGASCPKRRHAMCVAHPNCRMADKIGCFRSIGMRESSHERPTRHVLHRGLRHVGVVLPSLDEQTDIFMNLTGATACMIGGGVAGGVAYVCYSIVFDTVVMPVLVPPGSPMLSYGQ